MRIIQLLYDLSSGGGERFAVDLSNELSKNHEVTLLQIVSNRFEGNDHYLRDLSPGIKYINLNCKSGLSKEVYYRVYKAIKKIAPDVVHVHCGMFTCVLGALFLRNIKFVHTLHSDANRCLKMDSKKLKPIYKYLYSHKVTPVTISKQSSLSFQKLYNLKNDVLVYNGRSKMQTSDERDIVKAFVQSVKEHEDDAIFVHIARCHPVKNQEMLFRTFSNLHQTGRHMQLIVIGDGFDDMKTQWENGQGIHFIGRKNNVGDYLCFADYFILSSKMEGLPISMLEAMSMGIIPISTPCGGVCDVIRDGENGFLSPTMEQTDFEATIIRALDDKTVSRDSISKEYEEMYSMEICCKNYIKMAYQ